MGLAFALLAGVFFLAMGLLSGRQARQQTEADTGAALQQVAARMAVTLDAGMYERMREVHNLAALEGLLGDPIEPAGWRALVDRMQSSFHQYTWIGVVNVEGRVIAGTGGLLEGRSVAQRPWFAGGMAGPFVGDVHDAVLLAKLLPSQTPNEPLRLVDFAAPILRAGRPWGVMGAHLSMRWAEERRQQVQASLTPMRAVEILVLAQEGQVLLGPATPAPPPRGPAGAGGRVLPDGGHGLMAWGDGQTYLTAAARSAGYQTFPGLGWMVVVRQPERSAMAAADALQARIWGLGIVGALLFGAIGWGLAGWLTAPLRDVAQRARRIVAAADAAPGAPGLHAAQGNERDEVVQLTLSLETLVGQLRQRERDLLSLNESLESRVSQRTESLRQANADLQGFSRSVAHDFKGPIGTMGALVKRVLAGTSPPLAPAQQRSLTLVANECDRLVVLVDELMTLAMVEQRQLELMPVAMQALVATVLAELRVSAHPMAAAALRAQVVVADLPQVPGDAVLLRQVWHNLLANAVKFSANADPPHIDVQAEQGEREIVFSVADNGAGFDMSQAPRLFGVFQRLHKASDFPGTGVGLSIVKRVVHRHGGRVWATGSPGQGARFYFALPLRADVPTPLPVLVEA